MASQQVCRTAEDDGVPIRSPHAILDESAARVAAFVFKGIAEGTTCSTDSMTLAAPRPYPNMTLHQQGLPVLIRNGYNIMRDCNPPKDASLTGPPPGRTCFGTHTGTRWSGSCRTSAALRPGCTPRCGEGSARSPCNLHEWRRTERQLRHGHANYLRSKVR